MNCRDCEHELTQWLDQEWEKRESGHTAPAAELPEALRSHAALCPSCAARIEAARRLAADALAPVSTPPYLAARIASHLESAAGRRRNRRRLLRRIWVPVLSCAAAGLILTMALRTGRSETAAREAGVLVRCTLEAPQAAQVAVVGDWNNWNADSNPLRDPDGDGIWEAEIVLLPGREYRYQFTIDGSEWVPDPGTPLRIENGFGGLNSILQL